jgi:Mg-chelatase subunit ChlD
VTLWALLLSIALHLVLLAVFALVNFSQSSASASSAVTPRINLAQVRKMANSSPVVPKPKMKKTFSASRSYNSRTVKNSFKGRSETTISKAKPMPQVTVDDNDAVSVSSGVLSQSVEFFGSSTDSRKICFVVDCSGSMHGLFGLVRQQLKTSVDSLAQDQYFNIIFFSNGQLIKFADGRLLRATAKTRAEAFEFIDNVRPAGTTNALDALECAMKIRDRADQGPQLIYFLTDGLDFNEQDSRDDRFSILVENSRKTLAPAARINTIGFWAELNDRKILQTIARNSGGNFINID